MRATALRVRALWFMPIVLLMAAASSDSEGATVTYTYDQLGRVTTAVYDNGTCVAYAYDVNGNRTSQTTTLAGGTVQPQWGTGVLGCFQWTPQ